MTEVTFKEYFDALLEDELLGVKCGDCGEYTCPPKSTCENCGSRNIEKITLSGKGKIRTFTTTYTPPLGYKEEGPYVTALVELEEGPWLPGRIEIDPEKADELGQNLLNEKIKVYGEEAETEDFYPDKDRRVVPMFKLT